MDIKKLAKQENVIIGSEETVKGLKEGTIASVIVASNCPEDVKETITYYADLGDTEVEELDVPNTELGVMMKKPFPVAVISIPK